VGGDFEQACLHQRIVCELTGNPEWVRSSQGTVNLSDFNNDLGEELPGMTARGNIFNKPEFFSGSYNDLADQSQVADVSWEALRIGDPNTPVASMSGGNILVDTSMNPCNSQSFGSTTAKWGSIHGLTLLTGEVDANILYTGRYPIQLPGYGRLCGAGAPTRPHRLGDSGVTS
jgi:hypothetical protein